MTNSEPPGDPVAALADELRLVIEDISSVDHDHEQMVEALHLAQRLRQLLDGPAAPRWYDQLGPDGKPAPGAAESAFLRQSMYRGAHNPMAPPVRFEVEDRDDGSPGVIGRVRLGYAYEGPPHGVHGGMVSALFDDVLGATQRLVEHPGVTGRLTVHFRSITPVNADLVLRGWIERESDRRIVAHGTMHAGETLTAEAEALFVRVDFDEVKSRMAPD